MFVTPAHGQEAAPATGGAEAEGAHAGTEVPAGAGHEGGLFPPFDPSTFPSQLLWLAITFGLFYVFLKKVVLPRIGSILEVRRILFEQLAELQNFPNSDGPQIARRNDNPNR